MSDENSTPGSVPIPADATECPDCHASLFVPYSEPRCPFKEGPYFGSCGVKREPPTLVEAATALRKAVFPDRDGHNVCIALTDPRGRRLRAWPDFRDAVARLSA